MTLLELLYESDPDRHDRTVRAQATARDRARQHRQLCTCGGGERGHSPECEFEEVA